MPRITRRRRVGAPPDAVWELVSDPYSLPRWWPRAQRVEGIEGEGAGAEWTLVLGTAEGRGVRADFRCVEAKGGERLAWEQQVAGTPFARHLRRYAVEVSLAGEGEATEVTLTSTQALRGMSRLGSPMMRRAQAAMLDEALDGIERALT
ncbi:MAG: SRPBCC family protein [Chloroflexota bacterium]